MKFIFFNHQKHKKNTTVRLHIHNCYELVFCCYGSGIINYSKNLLTNTDSKNQTNYMLNQKTDSQFVFQESSTILFPPGMLHNERYLADETELISIGFISDSPVCFSQIMDADNYIRRNILNIEHEFINKRNFYTDNICYYLSICLNDIKRVIITNSSTSKTQNISYIVNYINEYLNSDINIDALARISGYSSDHFRVLFKQKTGLSPYKYIIQKKLEGSMNMITNTNKSLMEIAEWYGYENYFNFVVIFKKYFGHSPSFFRKNKKNL